MLLDAENTFETAEDQGLAMAGRSGSAPFVPESSRGRYGEDRRINPAALAAAAVIPAALIAALVYNRIEAPRPVEERLAMVTLSSAPPPPPPPPAETPPPQQSVVTVPKPLVELPVPTPPPIVAVERASEPVPALAPPSAPSPPAPPATATGTSTVDAGDIGTRMVSGEPPSYPTESRRKREQGTVVLALTLDITGRVTSISVVSSSGHRRLDDAALKAVRKWRWAPTHRDGRPVMVRGEVEIPFVLQA